MSTSRRSASISSARVGVVSMPVLTHGRTKHASGISALRKRTRYLWLFGLTADHYGVVGSYVQFKKLRGQVEAFVSEKVSPALEKATTRLKATVDTTSRLDALIAVLVSKGMITEDELKATEKVPEHTQSQA